MRSYRNESEKKECCSRNEDTDEDSNTTWGHIPIFCPGETTHRPIKDRKIENRILGLARAPIAFTESTSPVGPKVGSHLAPKGSSEAGYKGSLGASG